MLALTLVACGASRAFTRGERAAQAGEWDSAVEYFRTATQENPDRGEYKIALERATYAAAAAHADRARKAEEEGRLDEALREYRRASELDATNRQVAAKAAELERVIRERIEAARPPPEIDRLREQARKLSPEPILNPAQPLGPVRFNNAAIRDILIFMGEQTGINVTFDRDAAAVVDRPVTVNLEGVTLDQALQQIMTSNQLFYKVLNDRTIIVAQDNTQKRGQYEEQVVRTFFLSHTDATEMAQILNVMRVPGMAIQPNIVPNKTTNTIVVRASTSVVGIMERLIEANDKPRAEVVIDVEILEVSRERAKQYGLSLSQYQIGVQFSPEVSPNAVPVPVPNNNSGSAVQSQYGLEGRQHVRFLSHRALGRDQVPRERRQHQGTRQAAAARSGRPEDHTEPGRRGTGAEHHVYSARRGWRGNEPAHVLRLSANRHHRRRHTACDVYRRHHPRPVARKLGARTGHQHRRTESSVVHIAEGDDTASPTRRRIKPAGRAPPRR